MMEEIFSEHPEFKKVELEIIDEVTQQTQADQFQYEVVPTYIIDGKIVFEGIPNKESIVKVFDRAINS